MPLRTKDLALAGLIVLVWGVNFAVTKVGLAGLPPMLLGALRFVLAAFPAVLLVRRPRVPLRWYLAYGLTISVGQFALLFTALYVGMPTGLASLVLQAQAFFTLLLGAWWLHERWHRPQLMGLVMAALGLGFIGSAHGAAMPLLGFVFTLGAALSWSCGNIVSRKISQLGPINQFAFVVWASLVPPLPFFALSLWLEGPQTVYTALTGLNLASLGAVAYLAWAATLLGYGLWTYLLARYPANKVSPFTLLVPVVGLTTGWLVFDETLQAVHLIGGALLMLGLGVNLFGGPLLQRWRARGA